MFVADWAFRVCDLHELFGLVGTGWAQSYAGPVNPHATPEARALLAYLDSISGKATIAGQHNYPNEGSRWTDLAYELTGKYPGLFGQDFGFSADDKDSVLSRQATIEEVKRQYKNGAVITLTWHAVKPTEDEPVTFTGSVQGHLSDYEWKQLLTPGTPLYNRWCVQADVIAGYLRQLRDAHVPVLFRPYHEMNGNWFWWGGRPGKDGSAALYRQIYDRFVNVHHLDNLIWVWNGNDPGSRNEPLADYYPGPAYADILSVDIYGEFKQKYYDDIVTLADGKLITLGEVGTMPTPEVLAKQPRWLYFMVWSEFIQNANPLELSNAVYNSPNVLTRGDAQLAVPMAAIRKATEEKVGDKADADPVSTDASAESKALLARLLAAPGKAVLSGQENDASAPAAATALVTSLTGKQPAVYAADLGSVAAGSTLADTRRAIVRQAIQAHAGNSVVSLNWQAPRPTDDAPASAHGQLSDYEWNDLLTSGSALNDRWNAQVDELAATLKELEKAGIPVLWTPYPESNAKSFWWAGRKGVHGSGALYRELFQRLVESDGVHNLIWVWEADAPDSGPNGAGSFNDYFPGLLYVDALEVKLHNLDDRFAGGGSLVSFAAGKPVGVELVGELPSPKALTGQRGWSWFLAAPPLASSADFVVRTDALRKIYADPLVVSLPAAQ